MGGQKMEEPSALFRVQLQSYRLEEHAGTLDTTEVIIISGLCYVLVKENGSGQRSEEMMLESPAWEQ